MPGDHPLQKLCPDCRGAGIGLTATEQCPTCDGTGWRLQDVEAKPKRVHHPDHYNQVPGIECIDVVQHFNFNRGNVIKYVWRAGAKGDELEDLRKAMQYLEFEIARLEASSGTG